MEQRLHEYYSSRPPGWWANPRGCIVYDMAFYTAYGIISILRWKPVLELFADDGFNYTWEADHPNLSYALDADIEDTHRCLDFMLMRFARPRKYTTVSFITRTIVR